MRAEEKKSTGTAFLSWSSPEGLKNPDVGQATAARAAPFITVDNSHTWPLSTWNEASLDQKCCKGERAYTSIFAC